MPRKVNGTKYEEFCIEAFKKVGVKEENARIMAHLIVKDDMWGVAFHGTFHMITYIQKMLTGGTDPKAEPTVVTEGPNWAIMDAHDCQGYYANYRAMELTIKKAKETGMAFVLIKNSSHNGASGLYPVMAAEAGLIGFCCTNTFANMCAPGGKGNIIGNAPFAYAFPAGEHTKPMWLDVATSAAALSKVFKAQEGGYELPEDYIVDGDGLPTTDPNAEGFALLPFGGHKGYGLALAIDAITGVIANSEFFGNKELGPVNPLWMHVPKEIPHMTHCCIAIDIGMMIDEKDYKRNIDEFIDYVHGFPIRPVRQNGARRRC
jgi:ureidoglycolate dehydrogenase (NAD+)